MHLTDMTDVVHVPFTANSHHLLVITSASIVGALGIIIGGLDGGVPNSVFNKKNRGYS